MKIKINNDYIKYIIDIFIILIDALFLCILKTNTIFLILYAVFNIVFLSVLCIQKKADDCIAFSIIFMLFYTFFIDTFVHYLKLDVLIEMQFLYIVPLIITCLKIKNTNSKAFIITSTLYIIINFLIMFFSHKVSLVNYLLMMVNVIIFIMFYYIFNNTKVSPELKKLYTFIFIISSLLTVTQTVMGFHNDTRNGIFSVFGWGANTIFILFYVVYTYSLYLKKQTKLINLIICIVVSTILYICTESKAALIMVYLTIIIMTIVSSGLSLKKLMIIMLVMMMLPFAYKLLIKYNPKFTYLNNIEKVVGYYIGNNDTKYKYGRFTAIKEVYNELDGTTRSIGIGFGSAIPLYHTFYEELNRNEKMPYYIKKYGYFHGFQNTTIGSMLLDGGLLLILIVIIFILKKLVVSFICLRRDSSLIINYIQFGMLLYFIYLFTYNNILKDFRYMALAGVILGMSNSSYVRKEKNRVNESIKE